MHLIPMPKILQETKNFFAHKSLHVVTKGLEARIEKALTKLPLSKDGATMEINIGQGQGEKYILQITEDKVVVTADGLVGAFYGIQTLRQVFAHDEIPCLYIEDWQDFKYRGFYQAVTRGRVPKVEWLKQLVDQMAYYKLNSLQLYVEHTFVFQ